MDDVAELKAQIAALTVAVQALAGAKAAPPPTATFDEIGVWYSRRVTKAVFHSLTAFLRKFGARRVGDARKGDYLAWRDERGEGVTIQKRKRSIGTLNLELVQVSAMLRAAVAAELVPANPFEGIKKLKGKHERETTIDPIAHEQAFEPAPLLLRVYQAACIETGMRNSCEVRMMERSHVDRARGVISVPRMNTKGKLEMREVPMSDYLRGLLDELPVVVGSTYVFANPETKRPYSYTWFRTRSRLYLDKLPAAPGDRRVVTHDARHTTVTRLVRGGLPVAHSMKIVGHRTAAQHWKYDHLSPEDQARAKDVLDAERKGAKRSPGGNRSTYTAVHTPPKGGAGYTK